MTVADRIRQKRNELNLSQSELAAKAKYSDKTRVSKLENSGDDISMKQVKRIAVALGTTPAYLMGWEDEKGEDTQLGQLIKSYEKRELIESFSQYNPENLEQAMLLYEMYRKAPPEIQAAIETLLKSQLSDS